MTELGAKQKRRAENGMTALEAEVVESCRSLSIERTDVFRPASVTIPERSLIEHRLKWADQTLRGGFRERRRHLDRVEA
jgi:hypothetical protein